MTYDTVHDSMIMCWGGAPIRPPAAPAAEDRHVHHGEAGQGLHRSGIRIGPGAARSALRSPEKRMPTLELRAYARIKERLCHSWGGFGTLALPNSLDTLAARKPRCPRSSGFGPGPLEANASPAQVRSESQSAPFRGKRNTSEINTSEIIADFHWKVQMDVQWHFPMDVHVCDFWCNILPRPLEYRKRTMHRITQRRIPLAACDLSVSLRVKAA